MTDSLPDPLSLWLHASAVPAEAVDAESLAASMQALWRNQEELLKALGAAIGQAQIAELAIELMLHPMVRQAQLLELAPIPNPKQAVLLGAALSSWLAAQVALAQAAAGDIRAINWSEANVSVLQAWVWAFAKRQALFLESDKGQQLFAQLSQAWAGLDISPASSAHISVGHRPARLVACAPEDKCDKPALLLVGPPWCPLASFDTDSCGLIRDLQQGFNLQVLDWGGLQQVQNTSELREQVKGVLADFGRQQGAQVLDMTSTNLLPIDSALVVYHAPLSPEPARFQTVINNQTLSQLGLSRDFIPGELLAVLCDAIYPDWAVDAWLQSDTVGSTTLHLRRAWLQAMPSMSGGLLADLHRSEVLVAEKVTGEPIVGLGKSSLLQLLNGAQAEQLCQALVLKHS